RRFETDLPQAAAGDTLHAESPEELTEPGRALLVCETADRYCLRGPARRRKLRASRKAVIANGLQRECFAGQNLGLCLDVVIEIHHQVVGIRSLERQNARIFAV